MAGMGFLSPAKGFIFRISHISNVPWILSNGLRCRNAKRLDPGFVQIGHPEIIERRAQRLIRTPPGGTLSDYVAFYFTPASIMQLNIVTGYNVERVEAEDLVILVSSLDRVTEVGGKFLFTDRHASLATAQEFSDKADLAKIDWTILQRCDFRADPKDLGKKERYMAEALVHSALPLKGVLGLACRSVASEAKLKKMVENAGVDLKIKVHRDWFLR